MRHTLATTLLVSAVLLFNSSLPAATVTSTADSGPGSLRSALLAAAPGDTINFAVTGAITLTSGELLVDRSLTINGPGASNLVIQRSSAGVPDFRIFNISSGIVTISGLTLRNGREAVGAGINNSTTLTLNDSAILGSVATGKGGGINNSSTLIVSNCAVQGNSVVAPAGVPGFGGGVFNDGTMTVLFTRISSNSVTGGSGTNGFGGGVYNHGTMAFTNSAVNASSATGSGDGYGGGIFNDGTVTIATTTVASNSASGVGGGMANNLGSVTLDRSTISGNVAQGGASGLANGGGMANILGTVIVDNSTISGNSSPLGGGGIFNDEGNVTLTHSTVTANDTEAIVNSDGVVEIGNTILAGNVAPDLFTGQASDIHSDGFNLFGFLNISIAAGPGDRFNLTGSALRLGPLQNNGGPTFTHALLCGSPAINGGDNTGAPATDQRGFSRIVGGIIDIGSYESTNNALVITCSSTNKTVELGTAWIFDAPIATDDSTISIVSTVTNTAGHCGTDFDATRVWIATDACSNSASCSQKVTVVDTTAPVITCSNTNKTVELGAPWTFDLPTATDNSGTNTITIVSTVTNTAGHCGTDFDATRVWIATDACSNSASCSQKVTVVDTTAPVITCSNTNKTVELGAPWTFDLPTATDNSGTNTITIVSTVTNTAGHCGTDFDATRVWLATDACSNSASCSQKVTVVDTTAPVITCSNTNKTVELGAPWTFDLPTATDNSGTNTITIVSTVTNTASHCGTTFDATRVWIATDACSNSASCSQKVTVVDTTAPVITCSNTNKTVELGAPWTFDLPTATDNSGPNTITIVSTVTNTASHCGTTFDATRVWIATDACSNSASCSQKVTVVDTTAPVITCSNTNKTVELGTPWTFDVPTATDNSGTNTITIVSTVTNTAGHCGTTFDATRTWQATDLCGNSASCSQKVTVVDTNALVITCSSTNKTVELGTAWTFDAPTAIGNSGTNTITIVSTVTNTASHCGTTFDATRVWMATDACGNSASCSQKVTVVDTTAPVITCSNTNKTVELGTAWTFDLPTATDNSGTNTITIVSTVTNTASHCGTTFDATRVWMATDDCGNSASCSQKVTVVDTTAPVITCSNTNKTIELGTAWTFDIPTATDNSGTNTITIVSTVTNTASHCGTTFDATRVWMATDACGNSASCSQKVTVVDTTAPVITCSNTNKTVELGTAWTFDIPTATDNSGTNTITIVSTVTNTASHCGTTFDATRVWMATDDCGNSASCSQKVTVVDTTAPVITCSNTNKTIEFGTAWRFDVPMATDNSGTNTITIVSTVTNTASHCGTTFDATRVWMATDDCGNSASCSQKVTVVDTTAPVITCSNTNKTVELGTAWTFDIPTATDNSGTNTITIVSTVTNTASHCGTTFDATRVWMATDDCGNSASCSQKVTVVDTTAPVITCSNTNKTVELGAPWTFDIPTATDNSGTNTITIVSTVTNTASHCGTTFDATRVWIATDACSNSASCSQKVTVVDTTAPVITCSNTNKTVELGTAWTFDIPTATDNSGTNTITIVSTVTNTASHCGTTFDATRVWMATDDCGNSASCSQKVTVVDTTAPVITCSNTNKTIELGTAWTFDIPTATDNSGTNTITIVSTVTNTAGHCGTTFDATRTWQATDLCGNSASCSQKVTVVDTNALVITCSSTNKTVELGTAWTFDAPTAIGNSGTNTITIVSTVTNTASHCGTTFDATRVWMATDACGNSASCSQKVTVVDTTAPVITCSNTNKTVEFGIDWRFDVPTATDNSGTNTITIVSTVTNTASHCGTTFDATRVWMATDDCGNSASCSQKVTVVDTTAPVITCSNTNKTIELGTAWTFDIPTATDNGGTNTITIVSTVTNTASHCGTTFDATRVWIATDACGNSASCSQKVTVVDTTAPVITCSNTNKTIEFGTAWTFDIPTATDNSGTNTITIVSTVTNTASHCGTTFDATRVWMATDACGNSASCSQKVTVVDTTAPVITCSNTNKTIEFGTAWTFDIPTATDNSGTNTITIVSTVTNTASHCGTTFDATRVWMAADACGNSAQCSQKVTVVDTTAPVITCRNTNKTIEFGAAWTFDAPTAIDNSGTNTITIVSTVTNTAGHCGTTFDATRTWQATDLCGNSASCSQKVTVVDTTAPVITCSNTNKTIEFGTAWTFDAPTATDNSGTNTITIVSTVTNTAGHCGNTFDATRTWQAADGCGNSASCSQKVTVANTAPTIICAAPATVCTSSNSAAVSVSVTVTDADGDRLSVIWMVDGVAVQTNQVPASTPVTVAVIEFTAILAQGSHQITVSVSDASACRASCSSTIGVSSSLGDLYPIALSQKSLAGIAVGGVINDIYNGIKQGNFGWLTWRGSPSEPTLATSLTIPGNSSTYVNPKMPSDHVVSVGDWVQGKPGISNSEQVRKALDALEQIDITVPVWDRATGRGNNSLYHVVAFARVRILNYHLPHENRITARFLGLAQCD